jgi:diaminopimelate decarboxylase/aspartate kinase
MADRWLVLKFGGTSVAGRAQWETIASLADARRRDGFRVLLVCSAIAGVTNQLSALAANPDSESGLSGLLTVHKNLSDKLEVDQHAWLPEAELHLSHCIDRLSKNPGPAAQASLMAMGEWLSTRIGVQFLQKKLDAGWVDAREGLLASEEMNVSSNRRWLSAACDAGQDATLEEQWSGLAPILITQGFIARSSNGETVLLGRGGSDTSAALLAGRLNAERLEIWTDVPGLFSADPRLLPQARLLAEVDYAEAQEMAASGARVVHPRCIRAAAATNTPVMIGDVNRPNMKGTRIGGRIFEGSGVKTITCQVDMAVMLLQNLDTRHHVGFLAGVFEIFRNHGISVDLVATSETTTTVAFSRRINHLGPEELDRLTSDLEGRCKVDVFPDCVCVNLVGRGVRTALAHLGPSLRIFEDRPLLMLSQSANDLCLSILVNTGDHELLLRKAHEALIPVGESGREDVFGDSWEKIRESQ